MEKIRPNLHAVITTVVIAVLLAACSAGTPIPVVSLSKVVADSDLIVVGKILSLNAGPPLTRSFMGQEAHGKDVTGRIEIKQVLKGEIPDPYVSFTFFLPDTLAGVARPQIGASRVFFLRQGEGGWTFATPYRISSIGHPAQVGDSPDPMQRVLASIVAVVSAADSSTEQQLEALYELHGVKDQHVMDVLHTAINDRNPKVQVSALADLFLINDVSGLAKAEAAFAAPPNQLPEYLLHNLAYSIFMGVSTEKAMPELLALMQSRFTEARRAAAHALGKTYDRDAIVTLASGLEDPDLEVRYESVNALAAITEQSEWTTDLSGYRRNEMAYLKYWRGWVKEHQQ